MKRLLFAFLALVSFSSFAMNEEKAIDTLFQDFNQSDVPGASVMVIKDGKVLFAKGYGLANLEQKTACSTNSNFRLASVSKQFTAMAILILAENKKLSLDDRLTKFFPEFPAYGKEITIRHLLTHTSGLFDYEDGIPEGTTIPLNDREVLYILRQQNKTLFRPGTEFRYSNSGYAMLALLVEVASGETFPAYLKHHIFGPLGMTNTLAYLAGSSAVPNRAFGYKKGKEGFEFSDQSLTSAVLGDGGIYSSVADLFKWDQALYSEKLVSRKILKEAFTAHSPKSDMEGSGYGFGWYVGKYKDTDYIWHYGSTCGFSTKLERFPKKKLTVIILTNRRDTELSGVGRKIADLYW